MGNLEERVQNIEKAICGINALIHNVLPPAYAEELDKMVRDFFYCAESLGSDFSDIKFSRKHLK